MKIYIYYDEKLGSVDEIDIKKISSCIKESICPNEALRGASKRFKTLLETENTYKVILDHKNENEFDKIKKIEVE